MLSVARSLELRSHSVSSVTAWLKMKVVHRAFHVTIPISSRRSPISIVEIVDKELSNGDRYIGQWVDGKKHGHGKLIHVDGFVSEGTFINDRFHRSFKTVVKASGDVRILEQDDEEWEKQVVYTKSVNKEKHNIDTDNGFHCKTFPDESMYEGEWKEGKRHGQGIQTSATGQTLVGQFREDLIYNGKGTLEYPDGSAREGTWVDGCFKGIELGRLEIVSNRASYLKEHANKIELKDGVTMKSTEPAYPTSVLNANSDRLNVQEAAKIQEPKEPFILPPDSVSWRYEDGAHYNGEMRRRKRHGRGRYTSSQGHVLEGEFSEDRFWRGSGSMWYASTGGVVQGTWEQGVLQGHAKCVMADGSVFEGRFVDGRQNGYGTLTYPLGGRYEGHWQDGQRHGEGRVTSAAGQVWEGEFAQGKLWRGQGVLVHPDGVTCEGRWLDGKMEGRGRRISAQGHVWQGSFKAGRMHQGRGIFVHSNGVKLQGRWVDGRLEGPGQTTSPQGHVMKGVFENGELIKTNQHHASKGRKPEDVQKI